MCLAIPARVIELIDPDQAIVELEGVRKAICIALTPEASVDDYVIVHVGYAIGLLDEQEAQQTLALFADLASAEGAAS